MSADIKEEAENCEPGDSLSRGTHSLEEIRDDKPSRLAEPPFYLRCYKKRLVFDS